MNDLLKKINAHKKEEILVHKRKLGLLDIKRKSADQKPALNFYEVFKHSNSEVKIIAEMKKASPSAGLLWKDYSVQKITDLYQNAGAKALSVLTDAHYFQGSLDDLVKVKEISQIPVLRKDFILEDYQVYESRAFGADCILLIVASLEDSQIVDLQGRASELGMSVLIEMHEADEVERVKQLKFSSSCLWGINNRNLSTLQTSLNVFEKLAYKIPSSEILIAESGIKNRRDIEILLDAGAKGFLIGEHLLKAGLLGINDKMKELKGL